MALQWMQTGNLPLHPGSVNQQVMSKITSEFVSADSAGIFILWTAVNAWLPLECLGCCKSHAAAAQTKMELQIQG